MDDDAVEDFGEDIYSAGVWPLSSPPFQSKSGGVVDEEEEKRGERKRVGERGAQRGREAAPDDADDRARNIRARSP